MNYYRAGFRFAMGMMAARAIAAVAAMVAARALSTAHDTATALIDTQKTDQQDTDTSDTPADSFRLPGSVFGSVPVSDEALESVWNRMTPAMQDAMREKVRMHECNERVCEWVRAH